jgi:VWFA-related protein
LQKVADGLARIPGRKSLIWVTNGFPIVLDSHAVPGLGQDEVSYREYADPLIQELNRANVAVYSVDARGLQSCPTYGDVGTLQELSSRTGGTTFTNRNDLAEGMRLALEDSKASYTLGFSVPADATPGLHEISLRTTRPGVRLRYRGSYQLDGVAPPIAHRWARPDVKAGSLRRN